MYSAPDGDCGIWSLLQLTKHFEGVDDSLSYTEAAEAYYEEAMLTLEMWARAKSFKVTGMSRGQYRSVLAKLCN